MLMAFPKNYVRKRAESIVQVKKLRSVNLLLKEEVSTWQDAVDLCDKYEAELVYVSMIDYDNFLKCK
ncbi:hypothetical protein Avbf_19067 [Armadillidium vulgare]|nr:hypothetical protein Avbf_19067 [Armadillidium vulgare]